MDEERKYIGFGNVWVSEGQYGKYFSGNATFPWNNHPVTIKFIITKNKKKQEGTNQAEYVMKIKDAFPAKPYEKKAKKEEPEPFNEEKDGLPF